jgi:hypothetical protein
MLHSWVRMTGPHAAPPAVRARTWYWVPPPQVREHVPHALHAPNLQPTLGQVMVLPVHACSSMKELAEQAALAVCREGGMAYRTLVWVPGPQLVSQTDQVLLPVQASRIQLQQAAGRNHPLHTRQQESCGQLGVWIRAGLQGVASEVKLPNTLLPGSPHLWPGTTHQSDSGHGSAPVLEGHAGLVDPQFLWAYTQEGCRW